MKAEAKNKIKKLFPWLIVAVLITFGVVLYDAYKKSRGTQGWINGLRESLNYYDADSDSWRTADGWQEEMNQFVRNQAALAKFQGKSISEVVQANVNWSIDTSKPLQKLFLK